jgi:hypothetical protein
LRQRLTRRGVTLPSALVGSAFASDAQAGLSPALLSSTAKAALAIGRRQPIAEELITSSVLSLTREALSSMFFTKLKIGATLALVCLSAALACRPLLSIGVAQNPNSPTASSQKSSVPSATAQEANGAESPIERLQAAYNATKAALRSGLGTGVFEGHAGKKSEGLRLTIKAKATVAFNANKYYVKLDYERDQSRERKTMIIVYDGDNVYENTISDRITVTGMIGSVNEPHKIGDNAILGPSEFGYINPARLQDTTINLPFLRKRVDNSLEITGNPRVGYTGSYQAGKSAISEFQAFPKNGFNISSTKLLLDNRTYVAQTVTTSWARKEIVWYVSGVDKNYTPKGGADSSISRVKVILDQFEPNADVPNSYFEVGALKFIDGTRVFDHRLKDKAVEYRVRNGVIDFSMPE